MNTYIENIWGKKRKCYKSTRGETATNRQGFPSPNPHFDSLGFHTIRLKIVLQNASF